ncbi:hypothetical protein [Paeniglutamicibacter terrestris]|uniref:Minor tail protein n=1 Tax=Paeniglutamicibacter terrestris TaxID=2723403 RepID=A0ABX1G6C4_9MICC|nr:hypothetical protein [Paeniglutamicibacter terrestris]NKG21116.1 hypothetical protein [Paeniglutamicibacter terrestris]
MAITSSWYDGPWTVSEWAKGLATVGSARYSVANYDAWKVTIKTGTDRTVNIAAGTGAGSGVVDISTAVESVQVPVISSGTRWDLIVARRDWADVTGSATGSNGKGRTRFTYVQGGASKVIPSRNANYGVLDDQPLALIRVASGSSNVLEVVDLRIWVAPGGMTAVDDLVRQYVGWPGASIEIKGVLWQRRYNATTGAPEWVRPVEEWIKANAVTTPSVRITGTGDASATSTTHGFQVGATNSFNIAVDNNEVVGRNNGALVAVFFDGGITLGTANVGPNYAARRDYVDSKVNTRMGGNIAAGAVSVQPNTFVTDDGETYYRGSQLITFPAGRFTSIPRVTCSENTEVPGRVRSVSATDVTLTGCRIWVARNNTSTTGVTWIAVNAAD